MKVEISTEPFFTTNSKILKVRITPLDYTNFKFQCLMEGLGIADEWNHEIKAMGWFTYKKKADAARLISLLKRVFEYIRIEVVEK